MDGEKLKSVLERAVTDSESRIVFISAFITKVAVDWLAKRAPNNVDVHLNCRLQPFDIISGSTHISALITALENGWSVSCLHSLHAKIYAIDDRNIYAGSANLTSNGLKIYGVGNLEASVKVPPSPENLAFIENVCSSATKMSVHSLQKMQDYVDQKEVHISSYNWPDHILDEEEGIWSQDFFWAKPDGDKNSAEHIHDMEVLGLQDFDAADTSIRDRVRGARCVQWLTETLENEDGQELYFGRLTQALHSDLKDDPKPYRTNVKSLVQNLLSYCEAYLNDEIEISRPNYSQRIRLRK